MRTEEKMLEMILEVAKSDERIRAVGMNGSRTNPNVPKDWFRDYDIVYLVKDMKSFIEDTNWIDVFGERLIMQTPENSVMFTPELGGRFSYLMLFKDGNRIDLILAPIEEALTYCKEDSLTILLLDKDNIFPVLSAPSDKDYWVKQPSKDFLADCTNEFWWVSTYVAKGLWRKEILYAQDHLNLMRKMLIKMLEWKVGIETNFSISIGKSGKYLERYLQKKTWDMLQNTYADGKYESVWSAMFSATSLFEETADFVAKELQFVYPFEEANNVLVFLKHIKSLPANSIHF
jgi:aminoglycoside 6-adenylyltransferase